MYPPIYAVCAADAGVQAVLGSSPVRLWPFGEAPQGAVKPYAAWQVVSGSPENYLDTVPDMDAFTLQVDSYAKQAGDARACGEALRDAIEPSAHIVAWRGETKEAETNLYRHSFDVVWWVPR